MKKYYQYKGIKWAPAILAETLGCELSELEDTLEKLKHPKTPPVALPTPEEARDAASKFALVPELAQTNTAPVGAPTHGIVVTFAESCETKTFDSGVAMAEHFGCSTSSVSGAVARGTWKVRGLSKVEWLGA